MKKLYKLAFLVLIPIVLGFGLNIAGRLTSNDMLVTVGSGIFNYGTPAFMFILVVVCLILMITGKLSVDGKKKSDVTFRDDEEDGEPSEEADVSKEDGEPDWEPTAAEREMERIDDINSSYGDESRKKATDYHIAHTSKLYKYSTPREKVLGWLFFGFLITDFALILVFAFFHIWLGMFICFGIFAGAVIISLVVKVILEKASLSRKVDFKKYELTKGKVVGCLLSSYSNMGSGRTTRVSGVTYRIMLDVDGKSFNAYSIDAYDEGELLNVMVKKNGKGVAKIIGRVGEENCENADGADNLPPAI